MFLVEHCDDPIALVTQLVIVDGKDLMHLRVPNAHVERIPENEAVLLFPQGNDLDCVLIQKKRDELAPLVYKHRIWRLSL